MCENFSNDNGRVETLDSLIGRERRDFYKPNIGTIQIIQKERSLGKISSKMFPNVYLFQKEITFLLLFSSALEVKYVRRCRSKIFLELIQRKVEGAFDEQQRGQYFISKSITLLPMAQVSRNSVPAYTNFEFLGSLLRTAVTGTAMRSACLVFLEARKIKAQSMTQFPYAESCNASCVTPVTKTFPV